MKQVLQSLKTGETEVADVPCPAAQPGEVLIRTSRSLVSAGTERMLLEFGKGDYLQKARQQPDKVRQVLDKARTDGILPTIEAVRSKLEQPIPLGYCNAGVVIESGAPEFAPGDRVVSNGSHAEVVRVPRQLCARIPDGVDDESASFTCLAAIGLQGVRLIEPTIGETVVVSGLGLIGLLCVRLLRANGCRVLGLDFDAGRCEIARQFGATTVDLSRGEDPIVAATTFSRGRGVDAVLVAAASDSDEIMHQAAAMCRKRGRIVLVGVVGLKLRRDDFFKKEIRFQVSASYGPGRYDPAYEEQGHDYPVGFVRWTEQRNFEAVLDLMASGALDVRPLVTHRFAIGDAGQAYDVVAGTEPSLGIVLTYPGVGGAGSAGTVAHGEPVTRQTVALPMTASAGLGAAVSFIGSGSYATAILIPAFKAAGARLVTVASRTGVSAVHAGRKFGFARATTDTDATLADPAAQAVVIATRHDTHAGLVLQALAAGKSVFVEKPLCLTLAELDEIDRAMATDRGVAGRMLLVGFNRRFAPQVRKMRELLATVRGPKAFVMTVNAGSIPREHWVQDRATGGGRILGEACHFIDLLRCLTDSSIVATSVQAMASATDDSVNIGLRFADGSVGSIHYLANGSKAFPKERLEVFAAGRVLQLDNFRRLVAFGWPGFSRMNLWRQDKGQRACAAAFMTALRGQAASPIPWEELREVSRVSIEVAAQGRAS